MELLEAIYSRKTIREFLEKEIPFETIEKLIAAGLRAPSNNHLRQWHFIVLRDKKELLSLSNIVQAPKTVADTTELVDSWNLTNQLQKKMYLEGVSKQYSMIRDAQFVIIPAFLDNNNLLSPKSISSLNEFASIWCCIENILITAAGEGIYGVMRIPINREEEENAKRHLNLPDRYLIPCYLAMGYPHEKARAAKQVEFDIHEKIHLNKW